MALSGDYFNPFVKHDDLKTRYLKTVNKVEVSLPPNHCKIFETVSKFVDISSTSLSEHFFVHLHITPGLVEDYTELIKCIESTPVDQACIHVIIRIRLANLEEKDVDIRNLTRDLFTVQKRKRHFVSLYTINAYASDIEVDKLITKIFVQLIQNVEAYVDLT